MQTQIQCPSCGAAFSTEIHQIVDAQRTPHLKEMLLGGALNVAQCPQCQYASRLATPIMYHDNEHEMLIVHVPMELNWPMAEQERQIGRMAKAITDGLPPEQFKAYLLQPKTIMTMETFMEQVYATEGITPEMLDRQRKQAMLMQELVSADKLTQLSKIQDSEEIIDETFFAMLQSNLQMLEQNPAPEANRQFIVLTNLQARLFTMTKVGQQLEQEQLALTKFQQAVQKQGGLTYDIFIDQLMANDGNENVQSAMIKMGYQAIRYELFAELTGRIEKADPEEAEKLTNLREKLLEAFEAMQAETESAIASATETLNAILAAPSVTQGVQDNLTKVDETFMQFLASQLQAAEQSGDKSALERLEPVYQAIMTEAQNQLPPEVRLINALVATEDAAQMQEVINQIPADGRPAIKQMIESVIERAAAENPEVAAKLSQAIQLL
ncbi:MAG: CpXC domain-containing protein [Chloroflexota bacterium]